MKKICLICVICGAHYFIPMLTDITKEEVISRLKNAGISPSGPRIAVYHFLCANHIHPTVETIFHALLPENPTLSRTTVYNTLKLLLAKKLVQAVKIEDTEVRFDANTDFHAHFKCRQCDCIMDLFDVPCPAIPQSDDFQIEFPQVNFYGLCRNCQNKLKAVLVAGD